MTFLGCIIVALTIGTVGKMIAKSLLCIASAIALSQSKEIREEIQKDWNKIGDA